MKTKENINKIFTQEIRDDFKFNQEDKKIKNKIQNYQDYGTLVSYYRKIRLL